MDDWQNLLYQRYQTLNPKFQCCLGDKIYSKAEILEHIKKGDEVYNLLLKVEKGYFGAIKSGELKRIIDDNMVSVG